MEDANIKMEGSTNESSLPLEWMFWRTRFQDAMRKTFKRTPSIQDFDFFMLSLVRRLEKDTVESFREPKAQCFLRPALDKLSAASYCVFLSAHSPLSFSQKAIPEHVEAFFDNAEIKEEYRLAKSRYLQILLEDYETCLRDFSAMVVSGFDASAFEEIYGAHAEQGAQIILAFLGVYSLWAENHAQELEENADLAKIYGYVMEKFRNIARDLHYDVCERYFTEGPETDDQIIRDARVIAKELLSRVDRMIKDFFFDAYAKEAGVDYAPPKAKPLQVEIIPDAEVRQKRVEEWEKRRKEVQTLVSKYTNLDPSEINIDRIFCYTFNYLSWFIPETIRMQPRPICTSASVVRGEIVKLVQSGYATIKSSQMQRMIQRQDRFRPPQAILDACQVRPIFDYMRDLCQWALDEIVNGYRQTIQSIANGLLERFDYDVFKKTYANGKDYADWLVLCVVNTYRAWFEKYRELVEQDPRLQEAFQNAREYFLLLAKDFSLPICAYYFRVRTLFSDEDSEVVKQYREEVEKTRRKYGASLDPIIRDAQTLAQEVLLFLDENARDALVKNFATNACQKDAPEGSTPSDAT